MTGTYTVHLTATECRDADGELTSPWGGCEPGGAVTASCSREYTFSGHAYIGACEDCTFQLMIDEADHTTTGDSSCSLVSLPFRAVTDDRLSWNTIIHRPTVTTYGWYGHGPDGSVWTSTGSYSNAIAIRTMDSGWGHYAYYYDIVAFGPDVSVGDGEVSFDKTRTFYSDTHYYGEVVETVSTLQIDYVIPADVSEDGFFWTGSEFYIP
jgi:hypothetical protein